MTRASTRAVPPGIGAGLAVLLLLGGAACGGEESTTEAGATPAPSTTESETPTESPTAPDADPPPADDKPFGPGCGRLETDSGAGPERFRDEMELGIFTVIFRDLVGDGAALMDRSELLDPVDTTYFLPTNAAIDVLNRDQRGDLIFDDETRLQILGRHAVDGSLPPSALAGEHATVNGGTLQISVDGDDVRVGLQRARVLCGNIELKQGVRVYVIDQVLIT